MSIPTTASVRESAVISAPIDDLWNAIQLSNVHTFWTNLKDNSSEANVTKWTFKDGTVLDVKQEEHSVRPSSPMLRTGNQIMTNFRSEPQILLSPFSPHPRRQSASADLASSR
jgi:hypothetical protein